MHADDVLSLGLGVTPPWKLVGQRLDTDKRPNELHIEVAADRGARFLAAIGETFEQANVTVGWFHAVQLFT